jgi:hypothetical protein
MQALKDTLSSERGLWGLALIVAATTLTALSHMSVVEWQDYTIKVFGIFVGGKSLTTFAGLIRGGAAPAAPAPTPAPTPDPAPTPAPEAKS